jgi:hypothetical protein
MQTEGHNDGKTEEGGSCSGSCGKRLFSLMKRRSQVHPSQRLFRVAPLEDDDGEEEESEESTMVRGPMRHKHQNQSAKEAKKM